MTHLGAWVAAWEETLSEVNEEIEKSGLLWSGDATGVYNAAFLSGIARHTAAIADALEAIQKHYEAMDQDKQ